MYFKFKSAKEFDTVQFDGFFISPGDLKKSILSTLGDTTDNDLVLEDAETLGDGGAGAGGGRGGRQRCGRVGGAIGTGWGAWWGHVPFLPWSCQETR